MSRLLGETPKGLFILLAAEVPDLFGRFGIMALLALYMTKNLHYSDKVAFLTYSTFLMLSYITPLLGGYLADRYLTYPKAIILGGMVMFVGNCLMIVPQISFLYVGLSLVALGIGFFSPSLAATLDHLYKDRLEQRDGGFVLYYIAKNIGALLGPVMCGLLGEWVGYNYAFGLTALAILLGVVIFVWRRHLFVFEISAVKKYNFILDHFLIKAPVLANCLIVLILIPLVAVIFIDHLEGWVILIGAVVLFVMAVNLLKNSNRQEKINLMLIGLSALFSMIFFMLLAQGGTTFNLFIERLVNRHVFGFQLSSAVFYSINPIFMLLLGPVVIMLLKKMTRANHEMVVFLKYATAMFVFAIGIVIFVVAAGRAHEVGLISSGYVVLCYLILPVAELFIMPVAISLVTRLAPKKRTAQMYGVYVFGLAIGSYFNGIFSTRADINFPVNGLASQQHAALLYQHVFLDTFYILLVMGVLALLCYKLIGRFVTREA